jgi:hypothetical protein
MHAGRCFCWLREKVAERRPDFSLLPLCGTVSGGLR